MIVSEKSEFEVFLSKHHHPSMSISDELIHLNACNYQIYIENQFTVSIFTVSLYSTINSTITLLKVTDAI